MVYSTLLREFFDWFEGQDIHQGEIQVQEKFNTHFFI